MIELRWLSDRYLNEKRLQFRFMQYTVDSSGALCPGEWSWWDEVPTLIETTPITPEDETTREIPRNAVVDYYIRSLRWNDDVPDHVRTTVAGNIRGFHAWLVSEGRVR